MWPEEWTARAYRIVFSRVWRHCRSPDRAEDCVQYAFLQASQECRGEAAYFQSEAHFINWLARVACNRAITEGRAAWSARVGRVNDPAQLPPQSEGSSEAVRKCLARLSEQDRRILELAHYDRLSNNEIGKALFPDESAAASALGQRARRLRLEAEGRLRALLLDEGIAPEHWGLD
jgi:RNA polymerase sigma factor (sigma-70 family)